MKTWHRRGLSAVLLCVVGIAILLMGHFYFRYVSQRIYEDSTRHLVEIYSQTNNNFGDFLKRNWGNLRDWIHYVQNEDDEGVLNFINGRREYWKFSEFYFLTEDGSYITPEGSRGRLILNNSLDRLFEQGENIMVNETLPEGQAVTVLAIPVQEGMYRDFSYGAIAVSYTNADIIQSLNVDAFSGESRCFIVYTDGNVLLSTQNGGSVFGNYFTYLRAASDLDDEELERMRQDWEKGIEGVIRCQIGNVSYYLSYQPVGYENCILLGIVPESVASSGLLQIQRATVDVLIKVFLLAGALLTAWLIYYAWRKSHKSVLELRYREQMFDILSNNVDDIFLMLNSDNWKAEYISPNVERLLGIPSEEVMENVHLLEESVVDTYAAITTEEFKDIPIHGSRQWEREHIHQVTGEKRWYWEAVYHESIQGMEKFIFVMSDRTREQKVNQSLQEALDIAKSANKAKSHFLANMSHDIRTPMNAIIGFSVLLAKDADNAEKVREYTRKISASSQHLLGLINDVLDMSKIESGKTSLNISQFSMPGLLEELYTILLPQAKAKGQTFEFHSQGCSSELLLGDKLRLNQVLINLLSNSIKYTSDGGKIDFTVQELPQQSSQYAHLRFIVEDNGIGMSEEFLETIFDPFSRETTSATSSIQGTGLGMAITKNLVELMGGTIQVSSRLGEGSTFTVELTFALSMQEDEKEVWSRYGISRVLVVDDEEEICRDIQNMMSNTGVEVSYVTEGAAAVETAAAAKERQEDFNVILLDWSMPGMNGVETARRIREEVQADIPILILTSYDWSEIEEEAREAGINAFMSKPFFVSTFRQTLENLQTGKEQEIESTDDIEENILEGLSILIAEDNELNYEILSEMLNMEGVQCERAVNGQEALEIFLKSKPRYYDMILMDVQMPIMNGYEATRKIRACDHPRAQSIPIVAMTANAFAEDVRNALDSGMNGHLSKPVDMNAVRALLGKLRKSDDVEKEA